MQNVRMEFFPWEINEIFSNSFPDDYSPERRSLLKQLKILAISTHARAYTDTANGSASQLMFCADANRRRSRPFSSSFERCRSERVYEYILWIWMERAPFKSGWDSFYFFRCCCRCRSPLFYYSFMAAAAHEMRSRSSIVSHWKWDSRSIRDGVSEMDHHCPT